MIEEAVKRAKLFQLTLLDKGHAVSGISAEALRKASVTMTTQIELLSSETMVEAPTLDVAIREVVEKATKDSEKRVIDTLSQQ